MGARQSRRSVDITTTPKKEGLPVEGVVGDAAAPGDGKLEKIEEADAKPTTNGVALHTDATPEDKDKDKDEATEKEKEKEDAPKVEEPKVESPTAETPTEGAAEVTTPTEGTPASPTTATSPESKETKKKDKPKKKWSFRSISFGKKDKNKPVREDAPKNGDIVKEPLAEGGEEAETAAAANSPADEKAAVSSPTENEQNGAAAEAPAVATEAKAEDDQSTAAPVVAPAAVAVAASPAVEMKKEPSTPAPTPVPVEAKKVEEIEKEVEPANAEKIVEVSPVQAVIEAPVEVNSQSKPIATTTTTTTAPSIIERKTSEDFPSQFPSSPPPTPIDPSPLQQAQQVGANASAIAEALKLPAEAANKANIANASGQPVSTTFSTSPASSWRVDTSSTIAATLATEKLSKSPTSESPEQTGNALPIPVTITTIINAVTDIIEKPSSEPQKSDVQVTEFVTASDEAQFEDTVASDVAAIVTKEIVESQSLIETIDTAKPRENDLVIQTEEGLVPVSDDIVIEAKPALVVPDNIMEEIETVEVLMEAEKNRGSEKSMPEHVESMEGLIVTDKEKSEVSQTVSEPIVPVIEASNEESSEKDVPPPLPASPVPIPKATSQLLNFMSTQIEDSPVIAEIIDSSKDVTLLAEEIPSSLPPPSADLLETIEVIEITEESQSEAEEQMDTSCSLPPPEEIPDSRLEQLVELAEDNDLPPAPQEILEEEIFCQSLEGNVSDTENTINSEILESAISPAASIPQIPTDTTILTPPRSPSPTAVINLTSIDIPTRESSQLELLDVSSNREFKMESVEESLNSYDSELELKERLAETLEENTSVSCQLSNAVQENDQSKLEAPVENNVVANDIGTTQTNDDAPKSPPPAVPAEIPAPTLGPAITEDVASVTKAIEEIDINEKAVAAAVNENIESNNTNEIIADMNHQNNMNE